MKEKAVDSSATATGTTAKVQTVLADPAKLVPSKCDQIASGVAAAAKKDNSDTG